MRIAVSGTHCSGKSTLIDLFLESHREYFREPEPYEWLADLEPDFHQQLEFSVERLRSFNDQDQVIAERSPLDFLAYLLALGEDVSSFIETVRSTMEHIDLLVVLPLNDEDGIIAPDEEDLDLRDAMNEQLIGLIERDEFDLLVVELTGTPAERLAALERAIDVPEIAQVNELGLWDYTLSRIDDHTLLILGSNDFDYYHDFELELRGVTFCDLPDEFSHAEFKLMNRMRRRIDIAVAAEPKSDIGMHQYSIRAAEVSARIGTVYYYDRKELKPGERIAPWVKRK